MFDAGFQQRVCLGLLKHYFIFLSDQIPGLSDCGVCISSFRKPLDFKASITVIFSLSPRSSVQPSYGKLPPDGQIAVNFQAPIIVAPS